MPVQYVGVGEFKVTKTAGDFLKAVALGSCVAVVFLDPVNRIVGLLHAALPDSSINRKRVIEKPGMFVDTGIPVLLNEMSKLGYKEDGKLIVKLAGGASIMDPNNTFNIGNRNILAVRKVLWSYKLGAVAEDLYGSISRTVTVDVTNGTVTISSPGREEWRI